MFATIIFLIFLTGFFPIARAARANRQTTLLHSIIWTSVAWLGWTGVAYFDVLQAQPNDIMSPYPALALTGCASMAVLGARRPGVGAWNFVVLGLLAVMMFLWLEGRLAEDDLILHRVRTVFLASTVAIGILNYLPTRLAPAAFLLAFGCAVEILSISGSEWLTAHGDAIRITSRLLLALVPWAAYLQLRSQPKPRSEFDQIWLRFRNSYGMFWAQRLREQFNQSAKNSDWPMVLRWQGLRIQPGSAPPSPAYRAAMLDTLRALLKRFERAEK